MLFILKKNENHGTWYTISENLHYTKGHKPAKKDKYCIIHLHGVSRGVKFIEEKEELYAMNILPHFQNN